MVAPRAAPGTDPVVTVHRFLTSGRPDVMGHRGASEAAPPGNHLAAFRAAVDAGCDHLETDVQLSSDGEVVIFHDPRLDDVTTGSGEIADHTWAELAELRYVVDGRTTEHGLVRLADALDQLPDAYFNIDVKRDAAVEPTVEILRSRGARDRVCVAAFGWRRLRRLRRLLGAGWCTACSRPEIVVLRALSRLRAPLPRFGDAVQVPEQQRGITVVDRRFVEACHARDVQVHVWTVNEREQAERLAALGVDAIISDRPGDLFDWRG